MNRRIDFIGYSKIPNDFTKRSETIPEDLLDGIIDRIAEAPEGQAAVFACDDNLQAIKVADRLRLIIGSKCKFVARRSCVYGAKK